MKTVAIIGVTGLLAFVAIAALARRNAYAAEISQPIYIARPPGPLDPIKSFFGRFNDIF